MLHNIRCVHGEFLEGRHNGVLMCILIIEQCADHTMQSELPMQWRGYTGAAMLWVLVVEMLWEAAFSWSFCVLRSKRVALQGCFRSAVDLHILGGSPLRYVTRLFDYREAFVTDVFMMFLEENSIACAEIGVLAPASNQFFCVSYFVRGSAGCFSFVLSCRWCADCVALHVC